MKSKAQKRSEAAERQAQYDKLSLAEKLARVMQAPGSSKRELRRLKAKADA